MKIQLHSMTDLITNSSTVIYTYSDASVGALREMIDEIFKQFNIDKKCDDVFTLSVGLEDNYRYYDKVDDLGVDDLPEQLKNVEYGKRHERIDAFVNDVNCGKIEKPYWMTDVETGENGNGYRPSTDLIIVPKDEKYSNLAELIKKFLYSTETETGYDG